MVGGDYWVSDNTMSRLLSKESPPTLRTFWRDRSSTSTYDSWGQILLYFKKFYDQTIVVEYSKPHFCQYFRQYFCPFFIWRIIQNISQKSKKFLKYCWVYYRTPYFRSFAVCTNKLNFLLLYNPVFWNKYSRKFSTGDGRYKIRGQI